MLNMRSVFAGALFGLLFTVTGSTQSTFGSITGSVKDPTGAVIPAADVEVINTATGTTRHVPTSSAGIFNAPNLDIGAYRVRITAKGFTTYERENVHLTANQIVDLDVQLSLGATTEVMQVQAASPVITTEANDISGSMSHDSLEQLPLIARHDAGTGGIYTMVVYNTSTANFPSSGGVPSVQGSRYQVGVLPTMDGIAVMAYPQGAGPVQPGMEAIQELKVETNVAPAEFALVGNFQVVSKSGTNQFHAAAFWEYNGNRLNARNFFSPTVPFRVYNDFGVSGGGPIKKNKLFFFSDFEGSREAATTTLVESVPLLQWRNGDFTGSKAIVDPLTGSPFPGNIIPANRINPISQNIQKYAYPLPNAGAPGAVANDWTANFPGTTGFTVYNNIDARVDYNVTDKDSIFGRISWRRMPLTVPGIYPMFRDQTRYGESGVFSWNHTISPSAFNELRFGSTYHRNHYFANFDGGQLLQQLGIQGVPTTGVKTGPYFNISGVTPWNPATSSDVYQDNPETTLELLDNLSWNHGRHFMKFGFDFIRDIYGGNNIGPPVYGQYDFTGVYTGFGYADFLLGAPQTTELSIPSPDRSLRGNVWGMYAQDQFRVNGNLTLNLGMRWELPQPYTDKHGLLYTWNPATGGLVVPDNALKQINPLYPKNIPIQTASQAGFPANSLVNMHWAGIANLEPRIGLAYKLFGSDKTVLRAGYGIYSNLIYCELARSQMSGGPYAGSETFINALNNGVPLFSFPSPFLPTGVTAVQNVQGVNPNIALPYTQQWNVTIERQIASVGTRISYVASRTVHFGYLRNVNEPPPSATPFTTKLYPYQLYSQISYDDTGGYDAYNALEIAGKKKFGQNLTFDTGFTWAKDLTDIQDTSGGGTKYSGQQIQNQFCRTCERSNNEVVIPRRWYAYAIYSLPVGQGQRFLNGAHGFMQAVLGGWQTTWTAIMQSGEYFTPLFSGFDPSNTGVFGGVPDRIKDGNLPSGQQSVTHWFDTTAFAIPGCPLTNPVCGNPANAGRFGNAGWNYVAGPPIRNLDFGLAKDFRIQEKTRLRFNMTMANALNHPNFALPALNISAPGTVGVISGTTSAALVEPAGRQFNFSLRLSF